ncbi:DUF692 family protein [Actinomadura xylanilytica]|nr:DUF692 family multinuclear iron-containing protein [Actinomadura xylanilytica]MDL4771163.1 DUF692 family protein [Actinomadura xylanilytica]
MAGRRVRGGRLPHRAARTHRRAAPAGRRQRVRQRPQPRRGPLALLDRLPLERVAYCHVAGGVQQGGRYHDTHTAPVPAEVLDLIAELCGRHRPPGFLLERDGRYPPAGELRAELDAIADAAGMAAVT